MDTRLQCAACRQPAIEALGLALGLTTPLCFEHGRRAGQQLVARQGHDFTTVLALAGELRTLHVRATRAKISLTDGQG